MAVVFSLSRKIDTTNCHVLSLALTCTFKNDPFGQVPKRKPSATIGTNQFLGRLIQPKKVGLKCPSVSPQKVSSISMKYGMWVELAE